MVGTASRRQWFRSRLSNHGVPSRTRAQSVIREHVLMALYESFKSCRRWRNVIDSPTCRAVVLDERERSQRNQGWHGRPANKTKGRLASCLLAADCVGVTSLAANKLGTQGASSLSKLTYQHPHIHTPHLFGSAQPIPVCDLSFVPPHGQQPARHLDLTSKPTYRRRRPHRPD